MQNIDNSTKVKIYSVLAIFGIISLVIIGWWIWSDIYCGKLLLSIAPESSNITINGKKIQNGTHTMTPGKYKVEVSMASKVPRKSSKLNLVKKQIFH